MMNLTSSTHHHIIVLIELYEEKQDRRRKPLSVFRFVVTVFIEKKLLPPDRR